MAESDMRIPRVIPLALSCAFKCKTFPWPLSHCTCSIVPLLVALFPSQICHRECLCRVKCKIWKDLSSNVSYLLIIQQKLYHASNMYVNTPLPTAKNSFKVLWWMDRCRSFCQAGAWVGPQLVLRLGLSIGLICWRSAKPLHSMSHLMFDGWWLTVNSLNSKVEDVTYRIIPNSLRQQPRKINWIKGITKSDMIVSHWFSLPFAFKTVVLAFNKLSTNCTN